MSKPRYTDSARHGHARHGAETPTYKIWKGMLRRCYTPSTRSYPRYGGRGITVCQRWRDSYAAFLADMGERQENMTLDRKDNDGPYERGNCTWATRKQQARNRSSSHLVTFNGETKSLAEWSESHGMNLHTLLYRLRRGWPVELALTVKAKLGQQRIWP